VIIPGDRGGEYPGDHGAGRAGGVHSDVSVVRIGGSADGGLPGRPSRWADGGDPRNGGNDEPSRVGTAGDAERKSRRGGCRGEVGRGRAPGLSGGEAGGGSWFGSAGLRRAEKWDGGFAGVRGNAEMKRGDDAAAGAGTNFREVDYPGPRASIRTPPVRRAFHPGGGPGPIAPLVIPSLKTKPPTGRTAGRDIRGWPMFGSSNRPGAESVLASRLGRGG